METLQLTRATDIAPLESDGAKILWQSFSVENLPILELVADLNEGTRSNQVGKKFALMASLSNLLQC